MKKKIVCVLVAAMMALSGSVVYAADAADSDLAYIKDKGTLIVGITDFAPMDYKDETGTGSALMRILPQKWRKTSE